MKNRWLILVLIAVLLTAIPVSVAEMPLAKEGEERLGIVYFRTYYEDGVLKMPDDMWQIEISYNARGNALTVQLPPDGPDGLHYGGKPVWFTLDEDAPTGQGDFVALRDIEIAGDCYSGQITACTDEMIEFVPQFLNGERLPENSDPVRATITPETVSYMYDANSEHAATAYDHEISIDDEGNVLEIVPQNG